MSRYGKPKIFNTDQGSQSTSLDFIMPLKDSNTGISMDGKSLARQRLGERSGIEEIGRGLASWFRRLGRALGMSGIP